MKKETRGGKRENSGAKRIYVDAVTTTVYAPKAVILEAKKLHGSLGQALIFSVEKAKQ